MHTVYKYPIRCTTSPDVQEIELPADAQILSTHGQTLDTGRYSLHIWAKVDTENPPRKRHIVVLGTGCSLPTFNGELVFIGTFFLNDDSARVGHVFELIKNRRRAFKTKMTDK